MKERELDYILIWLRAAVMNKPDSSVKYFIDKKEVKLFNMVLMNNEWNIVNGEISIQYSGSDTMYLKKKIKDLKLHSPGILEIPKLSAEVIDKK